MKFLIPFFALLLAVVAHPSHAAPKSGADVSAPIHLTNPLPLDGNLQITSFRTSKDAAGNDQLLADGVITAVANNGSGDQNIVTNFTTQVVAINGHALTGLSRSALLAQAQQCTILDLTLGPINLDLLGLNVITNQIHIQIIAQQGGGLLGDLLCAIDNLLNGGTGNILQQIANLLNQILQAL